LHMPSWHWDIIIDRVVFHQAVFVRPAHVNSRSSEEHIPSEIGQAHNSQPVAPGIALHGDTSTSQGRPERAAQRYKLSECIAECRSKALHEGRSFPPESLLITELYLIVISPGVA
jgi:hypothetical protein